MVGNILGLAQLLAFVAVLAAALWMIRRVHGDDRFGLFVRVVLVLIGLGSGVALCFVRYTPSEDVAIFGLPLPLAVFKREQGHWVDYVGSPIAMLFIGVLNILLVSGILHGVAHLVLRRRNSPASGAVAGEP